MAARRGKPARRKAKQERAQETVDAVVEAAAQVLLREGYARASTNRIAEAAAAVKEKYQLTNVSGRNQTINGLEGYRMVADLPQQDPYSGQTTYLGFQTVLIQYNGLIYSFVGVSEKADFNSYKSTFDNTMLNFKVLTDFLFLLVL